jgi:iron-sulfur cluster assembly protein
MDTNVTTARPPRRALPPLMALTDAAADRLRSLYAKGQQGKLLRIGVGTKGCSGLSYQMSWVDAPGPGDEVVKDKDVTVLVDRKASLFLIGTVMDYEVTTLQAGFTFTNPNEKGRCGCGESFHV